ncbi:hypothetical protein KORDIASMS9_01305 [Kordia sp. SMS9]|uniref:hypothetical protein n=1 Tax=Kordia sp. SMS9 TaxID=2282170 RepID=UPI000E0CFB01|nr:hypothetical protein [Kordia sp. SMS9]AXG69086.1 hypothetical protein KORDIASMS9_01305 [Kordia sp. SMS9]
MKKLRNPYVSIILAFLALFVSCQPQEVANSENINDKAANGKTANQKLTIEIFVANHINIINNYMVNPEYYSNFPSNLSLDLEGYVNYEDLVFNLENTDIENTNEFANMYLHVQKNINVFLENYDFGSLTQQEIKNIILTEISDQLIDKSKSYHHNCGEAYRKAIARCDRNFYASLASVGVSTFWSFGVGTVIGIGAAGAIALNCAYEAKADLRECLANNQGQ